MLRQIAMVGLFLLAGCTMVAALPTCNKEVIELPSDKMTFAVVGDWGRQAAQASLYNHVTEEQCINGGHCCSMAVDYSFPNDFDYTDIDDAPQQLAAASLLDTICGEAGCQFILNMGDNFYPCGADDPESGINRFETDWISVYQTDATPNIKDLVWYGVLGNHDFGFLNSVNQTVAYSQNNSQWYMPYNYFATEFKAGNVSMQVEFLDQTPFQAAYAGWAGNNFTVNTAYVHEQFYATSVPSYLNSEATDVNSTTGMCAVPSDDATYITDFTDSATGQIPWVKSCLLGSDATWNAIVGHYALWGSDTNYADPSLTSAAKTAYPGQCGAWASLAALVDQYDITAYFNGHDHTQTHADPMNAGTMTGNTTVGGPNPAASTYYVEGAATQYFTLGNGGSNQYGDGVTYVAGVETAKAYNNFSHVVFNNNDQIDGGTPGVGFAIVTADECTFEIKLYSYVQYQPQMTPMHTIITDRCGSSNPVSAS